MNGFRFNLNWSKWTIWKVLFGFFMSGLRSDLAGRVRLFYLKNADKKQSLMNLPHIDWNIKMPPSGRNGPVYDNHILSISTHLKSIILFLLFDFRNIARECVSSVNEKGFIKSSFQFLSIFINNCWREANLPISKYFWNPKTNPWPVYVVNTDCYKQKATFFFMIHT